MLFPQAKGTKAKRGAPPNRIEDRQGSGLVLTRIMVVIELRVGKVRTTEWVGLAMRQMF